MTETHNDPDLIQETGDRIVAYSAAQETKTSGSKIRRKYLINKLNHLHFCNAGVELHLHSAEYGQSLYLTATTSPCVDDSIMLYPSLEENTPQQSVERLKQYQLEGISFKTAKGIYSFIPDRTEILKDGINIRLPSFGSFATNNAQSLIAAYNCRARIIQNAVEIEGWITSFSTSAFHFQCNPDDTRQLLINHQSRVHVIIMNPSEAVFSGSCQIQKTKTAKNTICLVPEDNHVQRFPAREYRSARLRLDNLPMIGFYHPLSALYLELRIEDISGTGFGISNTNAALFPGLKIENAVVSFPDSTRIICTVQVIHRAQEPEDQLIGLGILDIEPADHLKLLSILHQARDPYAFLCKKINIHQLIEFFFDSGFVYPQKYLHMHTHKDTILSVFDTLYNHSNNVSRHFIYQKGNHVLGHLAMLRAYEKSWLIHHHASAVEGGMNAGIHVLNQTTCFITDSYRFHKMNLDFIMCFFRPENRFPQRVFGSLVPQVNDNRMCSLDDMAYLHINAHQHLKGLPQHWSIEEPDTHDLTALTAFYKKTSGGLMLEAMDIFPEGSCNSALIREFEKIGIYRQIRLRALKYYGNVCAFFIQNLSAPGLNMSDLTNNIITFVLQKKMVSRKILLSAIAGLQKEQSSQDSPVLLFPSSCAGELKIEIEKKYQLWIIRSSLSDLYHEHVEGLFRKPVKNLSTSGKDR